LEPKWAPNDGKTLNTTPNGRCLSVWQTLTSLVNLKIALPETALPTATGRAAMNSLHSMYEG